MVQELVNCPECDGLIDAEAPEFIGSGEMVRQVGCQDCDWHAVEEWVLDAVDEG
jgi:hypothetical protein